MGLCGEVRRRHTGKTVVIPKGFINPNEDTVIEIPVHLDTNSSLIVKAPTDPGGALTVEAYDRAGDRSRGRQQYYEQTQKPSVSTTLGTPMQNTAADNPQESSFPTVSAPAPASSTPIPAASGPVPAASTPVPATLNPVPAASAPVPDRTLNTTESDYVHRGVISFASDPNSSRTARFRPDKNATLYISDIPQQSSGTNKEERLPFGSNFDNTTRFQPEMNSTAILHNSTINFGTQTREPDVSLPKFAQQENLISSRSSHSPICPICSQRTSLKSTLPHQSNYSNIAPGPFTTSTYAKTLEEEKTTKPPFVFINYPNSERYESSMRRSETAILSKLLDEKIDRVLKPLLLTLAKSLTEDEREINPKDSFTSFNQKYLSVKRSGELLSSSFEMKKSWWMDDDSDDYDKYYRRPKSKDYGEDLAKKSKTNVCTPNVCPSRKKPNVNFDDTDLSTRSQSQKRESVEGRRNVELPRRERSFSDLYKKGL